MNGFGTTAGTTFGGTLGSSFSGGTGSNSGFPDVNIKDTKTGDNVPIGGGLGWDDDFIQTQKVVDFPLIFSTPSSISVGVESSPVFVKRTSKYLVSLVLDTLSSVATVLPVYYDTNALRVIGSPITVTSLEPNSVAGFNCPLLIFDTLGSAKMAFLILSVSTGSILSGVVSSV